MKRYGVMIKSLISKFTLLGPIGMLCCATNRLYLSLLRRWFCFDHWHSTAPFCCRPYKQKVIDIIQSLDSQGVVEIGCGLGDVGRQLDKQIGVRYHGLDLEAEAIEAARYLTRQESLLTFDQGSFERLRNLPIGKFDILLLLNWPHNMDTKILAKKLIENNNPDIRYLLIDGIKQSVKKGYKFRHTPEGLSVLGISFKIKLVVEDLDEVRDLLVFERC